MKKFIMTNFVKFRKNNLTRRKGILSFVVAFTLLLTYLLTYLLRRDPYLQGDFRMMQKEYQGTVNIIL
ncbi:Uncharacterised protein [Streptococcus pneumoniae]|nr:Uncharacterised protein [Streptococcus pneumoniae]CJB92922.1 Uncharacterised protein [Streptococcus pneumoniae]CJH73699.1 Uncharacterised protein [Streptococcus pneumoniae]CJM16029.1 Uncharacterised protein [Streptococcus pneumoniae]CJV63045.1 Uncharacterised protein [Streptococcus pneumoniae]